MRGELFHRVRLGPFDSVDAADALIQRLAAIGIRAVSTQVE
jgi:cell division protein FtsN